MSKQLAVPYVKEEIKRRKTSNERITLYYLLIRHLEAYDEISNTFQFFADEDVGLTGLSTHYQLLYVELGDRGDVLSNCESQKTYT